MTCAKDRELWLIWQDPKTRLRHTVGKLWTKKDKYFFEYNDDGLKSAVQYGYRLHPAFTERRKIYESDKLFPAFAMRLPNKDRPDYVDILNKYGLTPGKEAIDILAITGGKLVTDNYELVTALYSCNNKKLDHEFYVAGWRYWDGPKLDQKTFQEDKILLIEPEPENQYDKFALQVKTRSGVKVGYVPAFYSKLIWHYIAKGCNCELKVLEFDSSQESSYVLRVKVTCDGECK